MGYGLARRGATKTLSTTWQRNGDEEVHEQDAQVGCQEATLDSLPGQEGPPPGVPQRFQGHLQRGGGFLRLGNEEGVRRGRLVREPPLLPERAGRCDDSRRRENIQVQQEVCWLGPFRGWRGRQEVAFLLRKP